MTTAELYSLFLTGRTLPTLTQSAARSLLDLCRSKLLGMGRTLKAASTGTTTQLKSALLEASRELNGGREALYNSASSLETEYTIAQAEDLLAMLQKHNGTKPATSAKPVAALPPSPARAAYAKARTALSPTKPTKPMTPQQLAAITKPTAAKPPARPTPRQAPAEPVRPLVKLSDAELKNLTSKYFNPVQNELAREELALRGWRKIPTGWAKSTDCASVRAAERAARAARHAAQ